MGRPKRELKKIHQKRIKKAKQKTQLYLKKELAADQLTRLAKRFLKKHLAR